MGLPVTWNTFVTRLETKIPLTFEKTPRPNSAQAQRPSGLRRRMPTATKVAAAHPTTTCQMVAGQLSIGVQKGYAATATSWAIR